MNSYAPVERSDYGHETDRYDVEVRGGAAKLTNREGLSLLRARRIAFAVEPDPRLRPLIAAAGPQLPVEPGDDQVDGLDWHRRRQAFFEASG